MAGDINIIIEEANSAIISRDYIFAEKILLKELEHTKELGSEDFMKLKSLLGKSYMRSGDLEKCLTVYKELNALKPNDLDILNNLGVAFRRLNKLNESISILERAKQLDSSNETTLYNLGNLYKEKGDYENASKCFITVLEKNPEDVLAYNHLGSIYMLCEEYNKAIESYKNGLRVDPNHPFLNFNLATLYKNLNQYDDAILKFKQALKTKPNWQDAMLAMADCFVQKNELEKAIELYKSVIEKNGEVENLLTRLAEIYQRKLNPIEAERYYKKALDVNKNFLPAILSYSKMLKNQNRYFDAYSILTEGKKNNHDNKELLLDIVDVSLILEDYTKAKENLKTLNEKWPNSSSVLRREGKLFSVLGETKKAEAIFEKLLQNSPEEIKLRLELAELYAHNDKYKIAIPEYQKYVKENPQDIYARLKLGKAYEGIKDYENAKQEYNKIIKNDSKNKEALAAIMELNKKQGNDIEAVRLANEIVDINVENQDINDLDALADSLKMYEDAVESYGNDSILNRNLEQFKASKEGVDITPDGLDEYDFTENEIEEDEIDFSEDLGSTSDMEMPFDDLMELSEQEEFDENSDEFEDLTDLVSFDEPINDEPLTNLPDTNKSFSDETQNPNSNDYIPEEEIQLGEPSTFEKPSAQEQLIAQEASTPQDFSSPSGRERASVANPEKGTTQKYPGHTQEQPTVSEPLPEPMQDQPVHQEASKPQDFSSPPGQKSSPITQPEKIDTPEYPAGGQKLPYGTQEAFAGDAMDDLNNAANALGNSSEAISTLDGFPRNLKPQEEFEAELEKIDTEEMLQLFYYLRDLLKSLPLEELKKFLISNERIQMEYVIHKLSGKVGFRNKAILLNFKTALTKSLVPQNLTEETLKDTLDYLRTIATQLPDKGFADSCVARIDALIYKLAD